MLLVYLLLFISTWMRLLQKELGLVSKLQLDPKVLLAYLTQIEDHYRPGVPYHNSIHGADVAQTLHYMVSIPSLQVQTSFSLYTCMVACLSDRSHLHTGVLIPMNQGLAVGLSCLVFNHPRDEGWPHHEPSRATCICLL